MLKTTSLDRRVFRSHGNKNTETGTMATKVHLSKTANSLAVVAKSSQSLTDYIMVMFMGQIGTERFPNFKYCHS